MAINSDAAYLLNFTSIYYWERKELAKSLIKTKPNGYKTSKLGNLFSN